MYFQVWQFIRGLYVPYPSLYDAGYTSLGNPDNTKPNPALKYETEAGEERFKPAYLLEDQSLERQGRSQNQDIIDSICDYLSEEVGLIYNICFEKQKMQK